MKELILEDGGDVRILEQTGLNKALFDKLLEDLISHASLVDGQVLSAVESTAKFCCMMRLGLSYWQTQERLLHSGWMISQVFNRMVETMAELKALWIRPPAAYLHPLIASMARRSPWFTHCIRAVDGTHVLVSEPAHLASRYRDRNGHRTQNNLIAIDFSANVTFCQAGWKGSVHDAHV